MVAMADKPTCHHIQEILSRYNRMLRERIIVSFFKHGVLWKFRLIYSLNKFFECTLDERHWSMC